MTATEAALGEPTTFFGGTPAPAWIESGPLRAAGSHSFVSVEGDGTGHVVRRERRAEESYATRYSRLGPEAGGCSVRHVLTPEVGHPCSPTSSRTMRAASRRLAALGRLPGAPRPRGWGLGPIRRLAGEPEGPFFAVCPAAGPDGAEFVVWTTEPGDGTVRSAACPPAGED
ncbi:MAG TPA: hypothetical protein VK915_07090 [Gaiellaceae bacterium]|nr:hypothetical protein [Gaiellaceae bacterium]